MANKNIIVEKSFALALQVIEYSEIRWRHYDTSSVTISN